MKSVVLHDIMQGAFRATTILRSSSETLSNTWYDTSYPASAARVAWYRRRRNSHLFPVFFRSEIPNEKVLPTGRISVKYPDQ